MGTLFVDVCKVEAVEPHPDADRVELVKIKGWVTVIPKGKFKPGDKCVFFPPDCALPPPLAERLGVAKYLGQRGRVKACRMRGVPSYGFATTLDEAGLPDLPIGDSVIESLGVEKWEPVIKCQQGDAEAAKAIFHRYTDIENINNFPDLIRQGEEVYITEKLHGTNCRFGWLPDGDDWRFFAGSHRVARRPPADRSTSLYWRHLDVAVESLLRDVSARNGHAHTIIFGEIYGLQGGMRYGMAGGKTGFRAFDISVNGRYLDFAEKCDLFSVYDVAMVPVLYRGPFSRAVVDQYTSGDTTLGTADKFRGREGVVVGLCVEAYRMNLRCVLKSINADYLSRGDIEDGH